MTIPHFDCLGPDRKDKSQIFITVQLIIDLLNTSRINGIFVMESQSWIDID
ncbi:MAG: hypothetical protein RSB82_03845 [Victivallaceae bacterium]